MCATRVRGEVSPTHCENRKKCPDFGKKGPNCVHIWVTFSIQNVVSRVSRRKNSKIFHCRATFSCVFDEMFIKVSQTPTTHPPTLPSKMFGCAPALTQALFFLQNASDLMLCTASDHDIFRILAYSALCFFRYIPACSVILSIIQAYSGACIHLAYSQPCHILSPDIFRTGGLFKTLENIDQAYSQPCHRALFSHIQAYSEPYAMLAYVKIVR